MGPGLACRHSGLACALIPLLLEKECELEVEPMTQDFNIVLYRREVSKQELCKGTGHGKADPEGQAQSGDAFFRVLDALSLTGKEEKTELDG